jgi:hypothetical protein
MVQGSERQARAAPSTELLESLERKTLILFFFRLESATTHKYVTLDNHRIDERDLANVQALVALQV